MCQTAVGTSTVEAIRRTDTDWMRTGSFIHSIIKVLHNISL